MISYMLRDTVSFCRVSGQLVFLDVGQDRYFCLPPQENALFERFIARDISAAELEQLAHSACCGALLTDRGFGEAPRPTTCTAVQEALPAEASAASRRATIEMVVRQYLATQSVRRRKFGRLVERVRARKATGLRHGANQSLKLAGEAVDAAARSRRFRTAHDQCLPNALAIVEYLAARNCYPDWVFGVRLAPFSAHCWVQMEGRPIADTRDYVRLFTPILVL